MIKARHTLEWAEHRSCWVRSAVIVLLLGVVVAMFGLPGVATSGAASSSLFNAVPNDVAATMGNQLEPAAWHLPSIAPSLNVQLLANAAPDECFSTIGGPPVPIGPNGCSQGQPKVNQAYVWGLTQEGTSMWYGTGSNVQCQVLGGYLGLTTGFEAPDATNPDYV